MRDDAHWWGCLVGQSPSGSGHCEGIPQQCGSSWYWKQFGVATRRGLGGVTGHWLGRRGSLRLPLSAFQQGRLASKWLCQHLIDALHRPALHRALGKLVAAGQAGINRRLHQIILGITRSSTKVITFQQKSS